MASLVLPNPLTQLHSREFEDVLNWAAISNAYHLFARWAKVLLTQCKEVLVKRGVSNSGGAAIESGCESFCAGPGGAVTNGEDLSVEELTDMCTLLKKMLAMERTVWDRRLSTHLMSLCQLGNPKSGARRTTPVVASYDSKGARSVRVCVERAVSRLRTTLSTSLPGLLGYVGATFVPTTKGRPGSCICVRSART